MPNVEPRGRNGHFVFSRSERIRTKSGAIIVAKRQQSGRAG
jgi:ribosomal protein L34